MDQCPMSMFMPLPMRPHVWGFGWTEVVENVSVEISLHSYSTLRTLQAYLAPFGRNIQRGRQTTDSDRYRPPII